MKKKPVAEESGNWMDTYGDLVTLLMTFFVMLYSMSNLNEQKWEVFVRSIYPASMDEASEQVVVDGTVGDMGGILEGSVDIPAPETEMEMDMGVLYLTLAAQLNEMGIDGVTISRGDDYTFIMFEDRTFFDGDSSVLTKQGEMILNVFCNAIASARNELSQVNIMAHTAQGNPGHPNNPRTDRMLSAMRAAEVCIFVQAQNVIEPEKLVNISYGQFRPVDTNDTREGRARNRRVEILMIDEGADIRSLNEYYEEYGSGVNTDRTVVTDGKPIGEPPGFESTGADPDGLSTTLSPLQGGADAESGFSSETTAIEGAAGIGTE